MGFSGSDDAGVIDLGDGNALIQTVDFFTPIVDDAYDWGRIAAANALSDVYAMGGDPLTSLQLVGWPRDELSMDLLGEVIRGGADVMAEAGCVIVGGHTIDDREPKYGFSVSGTAPVSEVLTNANATPGDVLFLTKPLGTGIISTAVKQGRASDEALTSAIETMVTLNSAAARAARRVGAVCATDVTGFGLLGHLAEVVRASGVSATIEVAAVPLLATARQNAEDGVVPGGTKRNLAAVRPMLDMGDATETDLLLLADAQTSGGLLVPIEAPLAEAFAQALDDEGAEGWRIGHITEKAFADGPAGQIRLV